MKRNAKTATLSKRVLSAALSVVLAFGLCPAVAFADDPEPQPPTPAGKVQVIVENTTFTDKTAPWQGELVNDWVDINSDSTMMSAVVTALDNHNYTQEGAESNYISEINGLGATDGGGQSGWMGTLNDWFTNEGFGGYTVANGSLVDGDLIRIMYTTNGFGEDLGGSWNNNDTSIKDIQFSAGTLDGAFDKSKYTYTLTVPANTESLKVTPTASNKNYQVRTFSSAATLPYQQCTADGYSKEINPDAKAFNSGISRTQDVPLAAEGDTIIKVVCGGSSNKEEGEGTEPWPSMNGAADEQVYTFTVKKEAAEKTAPIHIEGYNLYFSTIEMYAYDMATGTVSETNVLADKTMTPGTWNSYDCDLPLGFYQIRAAASDGTQVGATVAEVKDVELNNFDLCSISSLKASNSGWVKDVDYTLEVTLEMQDRTPRVFTMGEYSGCSLIALKGDTVTLKATPTEAHPTFMVGTTSTTVTTNTTVTVSCQESVQVTFNVPEGSTLSVGTLTKYYVYSYEEVGEPTAAENGTVNYTLTIPKGKDYYYRVQHPQGVTFWSYDKWSANSNVTVTADQLHIGDATVTKSTVDRSFTNKYDVGNMYLNINTAGCLDMQAGDTFQVNMFRNWYAIESYMNAKVAIPDAHYQVIDVNGNASDVVTITPDANNSCVANLTANANGTALVLVTYDAMTYRGGQGSSDDHNWFSASWPEFTGVFVVNVGDAGSVESNMVLSRVEEAQGATAIDSEFDILFYVGDEGADYSFKPAEGVNISVARSTVGSAMSFNGFTTEGVTTAADGTVTVSGLTTGRHIIKAEKDGVVDYQVVTARGVSYQLQDRDGNPLAEDAEIHAGDTIRVQYTGLVNPREKLSGAYNFNATVYYLDADGTVSKSTPSSAFGVYDFSSSAAQQCVTVRIPKYFTGDVYTLNGMIKMGGFAGVHHRGITYAAGTNPGFDAPSVNANLGAMPQLNIPVAPSEFFDCTVNLKDEQGQAVDIANATLVLTDVDNESVAVSEAGAFRVPAGTYNYAVYASGYYMAKGQIAVTAAGAYDITLETGTPGSWDGITATEPAQVDGVYQISTGAELAWLAQKTNDKTLTSGFVAVQTADIHLGNYPWTSINKVASYKAEYDGQGHSIMGLNAEFGLFYKLSTADSYIKNLTVNGSVTSAGNEAAGIVAYLNRGTVENCVNNATVTGTASGKNSFGGITGKIEYGTIKNCVNNGEISVAGNYAGGIAGYGYDNTAVITDSYNTANVTAANQAGGIVGNNAYVVAVSNCYNTGDITATAKAGGVVGDASKGIFTNCYSTGTVTGGKAFAGSVGSATFTNCYCLAEDDNATVVTEAQLRSAELGAAYKSVCNGYPALAWQTNVTAHQVTGTEVIAPTCTEGGYTIHSCANCEGFRDTFTAALGHTSDPAQEKVFPAYKDCVCSVCGESFVIWVDSRMAAFDLPTSGLANVAMSDEGAYPWAANAEDKTLTSSNKGVGNSTSTTKLAFTLTRGGTLSFNYGVSSENGWDKMTITIDADDAASTTDGLSSLEASTIVVADAISGEVNSTYSGEFEAGSYVLTMSYAKDSSGDSGKDGGYISNLTIVPGPVVYTATASYDGIQQPVKVGDTVTVKFIVTAEGEMAGMDATIGYDKDVLELKSIAAGEGIPNFQSDVEQAFFSFVGSDVPMGDGITVATATFEAKAQSEAAVVTLTEGAIIAVSGDPTSEFAPVVVPTEGLTIIGNVLLGDANCNGKINIVDAQVIYDIATAKYADGEGLLANLVVPGFNKATIAWAANVNADDAIDATDAFAIQRFAHYGSFGA